MHPLYIVVNGNGETANSTSKLLVLDSRFKNWNLIPDMKPYQFSEVLAMIMFSEHYQLINGHLKFTLLWELTSLISKAVGKMSFLSHLVEYVSSLVEYVNLTNIPKVKDCWFTQLQLSEAATKWLEHKMVSCPETLFFVIDASPGILQDFLILKTPPRKRFSNQTREWY